MSRPFFVALAALTVLFASCVSQEQYRRSLADNDNLRKQRDALAQDNRAMQEELARLNNEVGDLRTRAMDAAWIEAKKKEIAEILKRFENEELPPGVTAIYSDQGVGFSVEGAVLFASGKAEITPSGETTLRQLVKTLADSGREVRVDGHTDTDPIKHSAWVDNLELSAARAMAVARFLMREGVPSERVGIGGFGQYQPAQPGDSDAAKAKNRRVEILMLNS